MITTKQYNEFEHIHHQFDYIKVINKLNKLNLVTNKNGRTHSLIPDIQ